MDDNENTLRHDAEYANEVLSFLNLPKYLLFYDWHVIIFGVLKKEMV